MQVAAAAGPDTLRRRALGTAAVSLATWIGAAAAIVLGGPSRSWGIVLSAIATGAVVGALASSAHRRAREAGSVDGAVRVLAASAATLGVVVSTWLLAAAVIAAVVARDVVF